MRKTSILIILLLSTWPLLNYADEAYKGLSPSGQMVTIPNPNQQLLANPFPIYSDGKTAVNHPYPGFKKVNIPVDNSYKQNPGCYIMCYSHQPVLYLAGTDIYAHGMIRVAGKYKNTVCQPTGDENTDISAMKKFKQLCNSKIKTCKGGCWAGGATGGWYGIQPNR